MSLAEYEVGPIIPVSSLSTARSYHEERLGLRGESTPGGYQLHAGGGTTIYLLEVPQDAGASGAPLASFRVDDVDAVVERLRATGVEPMESDAIGFELDETGIARQEGLAVAWYRDPDGNVFTVFQAT